jgi:serine/threonine protein phosphatase PrpC
VSSEPQHKQHELTPADKLLILASDGVWEFISSLEAVELVGNSRTPEEGCRAVRKAAAAAAVLLTNKHRAKP